MPDRVSYAPSGTNAATCGIEVIEMITVYHARRSSLTAPPSYERDAYVLSAEVATDDLAEAVRRTQVVRSYGYDSEGVCAHFGGLLRPTQAGDVLERAGELYAVCCDGFVPVSWVYATEPVVTLVGLPGGLVPARGSSSLRHFRPGSGDLADWIRSTAFELFAAMRVETGGLIGFSSEPGFEAFLYPYRVAETRADWGDRSLPTVEVRLAADHVLAVQSDPAASGCDASPPDSPRTVESDFASFDAAFRRLAELLAEHDRHWLVALRRS